ncbi:hypothetical protein GCM10009737_32810 [Nocardioides lentus]|uniref:Histidine kinase/HSP90-like ATPase domain-containing protein n=1 Tax=Nocardioides lentus TaxID=338077 RepID=A0ABP5B2H9_9ACTN
MEPALVRSMRLPGRVESVDAVAAELVAVWQAAPDVSARDRLRVETALVEVVGNVVEHALVGAPDADLEVRVSVEAAAVVVDVTDPGAPLEVDLAGAVMPPADAVGGRGLALVLAVVDEAVYRRDGAVNHWTLRCERSEP